MLTHRSIPTLEKRPSGLMAWVIGAFGAAETFFVRRRLLIIAVSAGVAWALFWAVFWIASFLV